MPEKHPKVCGHRSTGTRKGGRIPAGAEAVVQSVQDLQGKRIARQGMEVKRDDKVVGRITSGCLSPTLGQSIAMAYIENGCAIGDKLSLTIGSKSVGAQIVDLPFYKR